MATKAEVAILTKRFALELGPDNITVNAVAPGFVRTDMNQRGRGAGDWQGTEESFAAKAMMGRIGEPGRHCQCGRFLSLARVWLDHGTDANRGRWTDGLYWTCVVVVSASALRPPSTVSICAVIQPNSLACARSMLKD